MGLLRAPAVASAKMATERATAGMARTGGGRGLRGSSASTSRRRMGCQQQQQQQQQYHRQG
eukprot:8535453-Alexandrium_andersonii.AAC.1